jgi:hypothetical protein
MTVLEVALNEREVAETQRKARTLRERLAETAPRAKVEVDTATLLKVLRFVGEARPKPDTQQRAPAHTGGDAVHRPAGDEISPQEAAGILGMSRPSVMRLIATGHLHPRKVLSRNKLSRAEVVAFQKRNAKQQREALENLSALSEEYGF